MVGVGTTPARRTDGRCAAGRAAERSEAARTVGSTGLLGGRALHSWSRRGECGANPGLVLDRATELIRLPAP